MRGTKRPSVAGCRVCFCVSHRVGAGGDVRLAAAARRGLGQGGVLRTFLPQAAMDVRPPRSASPSRGTSTPALVTNVVAMLPARRVSQPDVEELAGQQAAARPQSATPRTASPTPRSCGVSMNGGVLSQLSGESERSSDSGCRTSLNGGRSNRITPLPAVSIAGLVRSRMAPSSSAAAEPPIMVGNIGCKFVAVHISSCVSCFNTTVGAGHAFQQSTRISLA
jgi:hypothetical protein